MRRLRRFLRAFRERCDGISVTEYALLIAFVAVALIVVVQFAGNEITKVFDRATCTLSAYGSGGGNNGGENNTGSGNNGGENNTGRVCP